MGIIEKTETTTRASAADCDRFRLRGFVESLPADELERHSAPRGPGRRGGRARGQSESCPVRRGRGGAAAVGGERHRQPRAHRARLRGRGQRIDRRDPPPSRRQARYFRDRAPARPGPGDRADRRGRRPDRAAGPPAAWRRRGALHLVGHGFRGRSGERLDQCGDPAPDVARPPGGRHRSQLAERPARHLRSERRGREAAADQLCGRVASGRSRGRGDAAAGRRAVARRVPARGPAAGGEMRHQRHPGSGRCRMGARRLSRCPRPCGIGRALRRISRLLRARQAQSGVPPDRGDAPARRAVPNLDHRGLLARPHRHRAAQRRAHRGDDLAGARNGGARAGCRLCDHVERRHVQPAGGVAAAGRGRGPQRHRGLLRGTAQRQERVRGRPRHRRVLRPANGLGAGDAVPARPRLGGDERAANAAARSFAHEPEGRRQGRVRSDLAVRQRRTHRDPRAGAAAL